jgi:tetratricopeptide (TPR) repeat protein
MNAPLKWMALAVAMAVLSLHFVTGDHTLAEAQVRDFYLHMQAADFAAAQRSIDEAVRLWPGNFRYHAWRGYWRSQNLPSQCPQGADAGSGLNRAALASATQAVADYQTALALNPWDPVVHHNLGWLNHLLGHRQAARREWEEAVRLDPDDAIFHLSLGLFLEETGDEQSSRNEYIKTIQLSPETLDSPFFTRYSRRFPEAAASIVERCIAELEAALRRGDDPILKARLGKLYLYIHDLPRSASLLEQTARQLPNLPLVWLNLGDLLSARGRSSEAAACYSKARTLDPQLAGPWLRLGQLHKEHGERPAAAQDLLAAGQRWARKTPVTAAHNNRLYRGAPQQIDDLLPTTLVWYATPCEASAAYSALSEIAPGNRLYASRRETCEQLPAPHRLESK